jgi:mediator of RNA polymerase II transcription subunit 6
METTQEKSGDANKKQTEDSSTGTAAAAASLPDADPELIKKLEKELLTHPKKHQNTTLLFNAMRTTAVHSFRTFHEREAAATTAAAPSEVGAAPEGQRSSTTPAPAPITSQSAGSQSSGPSVSQDSAKSTVGTAKRKKKRTCAFLDLNSSASSYCMNG